MNHIPQGEIEANVAMNGTASSRRCDGRDITMNDNNNQVFGNDQQQAGAQRPETLRYVQSAQLHHHRQPSGSGAGFDTHMHPSISQHHTSRPPVLHSASSSQSWVQGQPGPATSTHVPAPTVGPSRLHPQYAQPESSMPTHQHHYPNSHVYAHPHLYSSQSKPQGQMEMNYKQHERSYSGSVSSTSIPTPISATYATTSVQSYPPPPSLVPAHAQANSHLPTPNQASHTSQSLAVAFATPPTVPSSFQSSEAQALMGRPSLVPTHPQSSGPVPAQSNDTGALCISASLRRAAGSTFPTLNASKDAPVHAQVVESVKVSSPAQGPHEQKAQVDAQRDQEKKQQKFPLPSPRRGVSPSVQMAAAQLMKIIDAQRKDAVQGVLALQERDRSRRESQCSTDSDLQRRFYQQSAHIQSLEEKLKNQGLYIQQQMQHMQQREQEIQRLRHVANEARQEAERAKERGKYFANELTGTTETLRRVRQERNMLRKAIGIGAQNGNGAREAVGIRPAASAPDVKARIDSKTQNRVIIDLDPDPKRTVPAPASTSVVDNSQPQPGISAGNHPCPPQQPQAKATLLASGRTDPTVMSIAQENEALRAQLARVRDVLQLGETVRAALNNGREASGTGMNMHTPLNSNPTFPGGLPDLEAMQRVVDAARAAEMAGNKPSSETNNGFDGSSLLTPPASEIFPHAQPAVRDVTADVAVPAKAGTVGSGLIGTTSEATQAPVEMVSNRVPLQKLNVLQPTQSSLPFQKEMDSSNMVPQKRQRPSSPSRESDEKDLGRSPTRLRG